MRIVYVANIRLPTEKAHGIQIMKTCEAFAREGSVVELVVPKRATHISTEPFAYYGVAKTFAVSYLPVVDTVSWGPLGFIVETFSFAFKVLRHLLQKDTLVYGRDHSVLAILLFFGFKNIVWESHTGASGAVAMYVARRAKAVVVITEGLRMFYIERGVAKEKIITAHDGVTLADFTHTEAQDVARARLGLPQDKKVALYIGRLDGWKGVDTLCKAAALLPFGCVVAIIGGEEEQINKFKKQYKEVLFLGFRPYTELPNNQVAADVLVLPNTGKDEVAVRFTSPLKLFTYMASHVPIVASDLPSIREILSEESCYFVASDNPKALAEAIVEALSNEEAAKEKANRAFEVVAQFDWQKRAQKILTFILEKKA